MKSSGTSSASELAKMDATASENKASSESANGTLQGVEVAKEAKEKKDKSSWVKTIGMRTLRLRKSTDSRSSSRLSIPGFSSLDRPGKSKKNKGGKADSNEKIESTGELKPESTTNIPNRKTTSGNEHVKGQNNVVSAASSVSGPTTSKDATTMVAQCPDRRASGENSDKQDPARFGGDGLTFKGKLIGVLEVSGPRGDRICQEALSELKMAVKAAGEHKQKITIHIALDGLRIRDEKTGDCLYHHQVHKISFIAQDLTDTRAFGYIFGSPDSGHRFFGIKTEKSASQVVIAMRDLFQVVFDFKKKEIEKAKQQLDMQKKFLATRAQERDIVPTKPEPKFSIAETYIEGACSMGASSSSAVPNRSAPEVDLLNLEVELTSLQEGLDSIHHNLADSGPFRGSTASISSDPMNPMPKRSSVSSSTNNTTPVPPAFTATHDPFGDSFDPYFESVNHGATGNSGSSSSKLAGPQNAASCNNSALTSPFASDPFAQVDPFPGPKFPGDSEFFNSDPFDSPSGPFSFTFPSDSNSANPGKVSEGQLNNTTSISACSPAPANRKPHSNDVPSVCEPSAQKKNMDGWTASFEDNFVPDSEAVQGPSSGFSSDGRPEVDIFTDLDPLGTGRVRPFVDRKDFFHELKNPPKKLLNDPNSSDVAVANESTSAVLSVNSPKPVATLSASTIGDNAAKTSMLDGSSIPNSFSTNFNPASNTNVADFDSNFKTSAASFSATSESPPNYSPPPPPRADLKLASTLGRQSGQNTRGVPLIPPPSSNSPSTLRLMNKKSPQILKQMTIGESNSSPRTLPRLSDRIGKQFTIDTSLKDDIPNLSPPPRPPHSSHVPTAAVAAQKPVSAQMTSAVPRPTSASSADKLRKISGSGSIGAGLPPEPPPRPIPTNPISQPAKQMQLVSPPPLPPKKQSLNTTLSNPLGYKPSFSVDTRSLASNSTRSSISDSNDLPLPLPLRKTHGISSEQSNNVSNLHQGLGGRYTVPLNASLSSGSPSPSQTKRENGRPTSSADSVASNLSSVSSVSKLSMEQALKQVAMLSLGDLANKLELPVERLSSFTIQQLAEKLTDMDFETKTQAKKVKEYVIASTAATEQNSDQFGFDDDFSTASTASAPANVNLQKDSSYDRYAVFRELALEDASGFSIVNNCSENSSVMVNYSDDEDQSRTLGKNFTSRDSSSERTLQADDLTIGSNHKNASIATINLANTMDDVTDVNLSDDQDNGKFPMDDEDDLSTGFVNKPEWATFDPNFDDQFATTALVKAEEEANDSPWDSDEGVKVTKTVPGQLSEKDHFDFKPFEKPSEPSPKDEQEKKTDKHVGHDRDRDQRHKNDLSPDRIKSPPGQFRRQSSGSSRHSERSSGNGGAPGRSSDYSDSGRPSVHVPVKARKGSKDYDRWELDREREGSGRYRERERDRDYVRSDSRNSYSSMSLSRKYRNGGDSEEDYVPPSNSSLRRGKPIVGTGRRSDREYEREVEVEDEEDDRSYASYHSTYSSGHRRHRRYPPKHYHHSGRSGGRRGAGSPERYSNQESDDESLEDETGAYPRKRDREYYAREREYYERHHRPRPTSSGGVSSKRHSRESPRHSDPYYRRGDRRGRQRDEEEFADSRDFSDYSGEEEYRQGYHGHGSHRRIRGKRSHHRDRERDHREPRSHYYTNSPSWDSESGPEPTGKEPNLPVRSGKEKHRRPGSAKYEEERYYSRGSPELLKQYNEGSSGRRASGSAGHTRRYQSELALNSKTGDGQKLTAFNFEDDFGASSLPPETPTSQNSRQVSDQLSSPTRERRKSLTHEQVERGSEKVSTSSGVNEFVSCNSELPVEGKTSQSHSPFEDNFVASTGSPPEVPLRNGNDNISIIEKDLWEMNDEDNSKSPTQTNFEVVTADGNGGVSPNKTNHKESRGQDNVGDQDFVQDAKGLMSMPLSGGFPATIEEDESENTSGSGNYPNADVFPPANESKVFNFSGRRLESIKSEEEKSNDDSHSHSASESAVQMKKSDSFNIFKQRADDPFADDDFFA